MIKIEILRKVGWWETALPKAVCQRFASSNVPRTHLEGGQTAGLQFWMEQWRKCISEVFPGGAAAGPSGTH